MQLAAARPACSPGPVLNPLSFAPGPLCRPAGLEVDADTAAAMEAHATAIAQLPQGRLQMELGSLMAHGAARPSLALMWRLGLLDMLLPQQALYLRVGDVRSARARARAGGLGWYCGRQRREPGLARQVWHLRSCHARGRSCFLGGACSSCPSKAFNQHTAAASMRSGPCKGRQGSTAMQPRQAEGRRA